MKANHFLPLALCVVSVASAAPKELVLFDAVSNRLECAGTYAFARGDWDVSSYGEVVVEFAQPLPPGVSFCVRLENDGAEHGDLRGNHSRGVFETVASSGKGLAAGAWKMPPYVEDFQRCLCDMYGVRSSGLQYLVWPNPLWATWSMQGIGASRIRSWTLDPRRVTKAGVERLYPGLYAPPPGAEAPLVKRILVRGAAPKILAGHLPPFAKLSPEKFFPFIDKYGQFVHNDWPGKIRSDADLAAAKEAEDDDLAAHPGPKDWDKWGGWADGPILKATGHFRVEKVNGKWWFVDPDGRLWWSHGPVRVSASCGMTPVEPRRDKSFAWLPPKEGDEYSAFYKTRDELMWPYYIKFGCTNTFDFTAANLRRKYGPDWFAAWSDKAHRRLRSWGANTIANSSDIRVARQDRTPYADRFELKSRPIAGTEKVVAWWPFRDPFDPGFRPEVRRQMALHKTEMDDPWCFGFFVDNELPWGAPEALGEQTWDSPEDQPARREFVKWLEAKYGSVPAQPSKEDCVAFSAVVAHAYFKGVREEFKAMAPHKLYMGCRFTGGGCFAMPIAAQYCDVVSCNYYRKDLTGIDMPLFDKPFIIGEFHVSALDRGPIEPGLIMVRDQQSRADVYRRYFRSALADPRCIGAHWHQFSDDVPTGRYDGENFQIGWVDVCDTPYAETIAAVRDIGYDLYRFRNAAGVVKFGEPFSDHMVLQRGKPVPVWGTAEPGATVKVSFAGQSVSAKADDKGRWRVTLSPLEASKTPQVLVAGDAEVKDVLVGEVWFASGQSNMDCPIVGAYPRYRDAKGAMMTQFVNRPDIRFVKAPKLTSARPMAHCCGESLGWQKFLPDSFVTDPERGALSAVAFYFALQLEEALDMPVGIVDASWGGTPIETWIPADSPTMRPALRIGETKQPEHRDAYLYNAMVNPYAPMACRGLIWYQGCSNARRYEGYAAKMHALLDGWRMKFENPDLSMRFAYLAPYDTSWWNVQLEQARFDDEEADATGVVLSDRGTMNDIHPNDKQIVGQRLALQALGEDYGFKVKCRSPRVKGWTVKDGVVTLTFHDAEALYMYNAGRTFETGMEILGEDGQWHEAKIRNLLTEANGYQDGRIEGNTLLLSADGVKEPKGLRYLYQRPYYSPFFNEANLPLGPFEVRRP